MRLFESFFNNMFSRSKIAPNFGKEHLMIYFIDESLHTRVRKSKLFAFCINNETVD